MRRAFPALSLSLLLVQPVPAFPQPAPAGGASSGAAKGAGSPAGGVEGPGATGPQKGGMDLPEPPNAVPMDTLPGTSAPNTTLTPLLSTPLRPPRMLSDTKEYCDKLLDTIANLRTVQGRLAPEIDQIAGEGQRMCDQGNYRGGTIRLRTALMLAQHDQNGTAKP